MTMRTTTKKIWAILAGLLMLSDLASGQSAAARVDYSVIPAELANRAILLREQALLDDLSVDVVESLTTEVGPRRAGTEGDQRGVAWAVAKFGELGFDRVWTEEVDIEHGWVRGGASAEILAPYPHDLVLTSLGYSVGTNGDLVADIVEFERFEDLEAVPEGDSLKGKIAFISYSMADFVPQPGQQPMAGYGEGTKARGRGHVTAAKRGAEAIVIRSVGTDDNRYAHTGSGYGYEDGVRKIPAAAISPPDAILIQNMLKRGKPVTVKLNLGAEITGPFQTHNVIGEITGREGSDKFLVLGAHLDSWDEGTGAIDDGAGVASMIAAAAMIGRVERRPRRSIRVLLFGAEEVGLLGVRAYAAKHISELDRHLLGAEVDGGGGRINTLNPGVGERALPVVREMYKLIAPLGIAWSDANDAKGASDMSILGRAGMPALDLMQNSNDYFNYHHTPNDTFDKIIPQDMRFLTAAYATLFYVAAEMDVDFRQ